jgi:hypothetical protein
MRNRIAAASVQARRVAFWKKQHPKWYRAWPRNMRETAYSRPLCGKSAAGLLIFEHFPEGYR